MKLAFKLISKNVLLSLGLTAASTTDGAIRKKMYQKVQQH